MPHRLVVEFPTDVRPQPGGPPVDGHPVQHQVVHHRGRLLVPDKHTHSLSCESIYHVEDELIVVHLRVLEVDGEHLIELAGRRQAHHRPGRRRSESLANLTPVVDRF